MPVDSADAICANNTVYVFGRSDEGVVQCLDMNTNKWQRCNDLPKDMDIRNLAWNGGSEILALTCSKKDSLDPSVFFQCYDTLNDTWQIRSKTPIELECDDGVSLLPVDTDIYIIGSYHRKCLHSRDSGYTWEELCETVGPQMFPNGVYICGRIFLFGGLRDVPSPSLKCYYSSNEEYDIARNTWNISFFPLPYELHSDCYTVI